jgi:hypothetical protein
MFTGSQLDCTNATCAANSTKKNDFLNGKLSGKVDGFCFLGGGVRCAVGQYAVMFAIMNKLKLIPEEMLYYTKYLSCNSGGAFTMASLLCYPMMKSLWPIHTIKDMDPSSDDLYNFYMKYWIKPTQDSFPQSARVDGTKDSLFQAESMLNVFQNSWINALSTLAIKPFSDAIGNIQFKDVPLAKSENKVISFGATANGGLDSQGWGPPNSHIRVTQAKLPNMVPYLSSVGYKWTKPGDLPNGDERAQGTIGYPINLIYGYGNKPQEKTPTTFFNGEMGSIEYTQTQRQSGDLIKCGTAIAAMIKQIKPSSLHLHSHRSSFESYDKQDGSITKTTKNPPNIPLVESKLGDSLFLSVVGASSSYLGCVTQTGPLSNPPECVMNYLNYDQPIVFDMENGYLFGNSASDPNATHTDNFKSYPQSPNKDNGSLDLTKTKNPQLINLCDGTNSYDNTGILPMIRSWQMYESPTDLASKTYTIFYMDGIDPGDDGTLPSTAHFAKLFNKSQYATGYGIQIFDADVTDYTMTMKSCTVKNQLDNSDMYITMFYYEGLTTITNEYCGIQPGIKMNIFVINPVTPMDTKYDHYDELANYGTINRQLLQLLQKMDNDCNWITKLFKKPPSTYGCKDYKCTEGTGNMSLSDCHKNCQKPPTPSSIGFSCDQTTMQCVPGTDYSSLADCKKVCQKPAPPPSPGQLTDTTSTMGRTFSIVLIVVAIFVVVAIVAHRHHDIHYQNNTSRKRKLM